MGFRRRSAQVAAQNGGPDPFDKYPFDRWLSEREQPAIRWTATVATPRLSFHQRLVATVDVKVDGRDLVGRRKGDLIYFVQITDAAGVRYQNHGSIDLAKLEDDVKSVDLQYLADAFVLPGEYQLATAILDTATGEHSARTSRFRVAQPKLDLLRSAWERLPAVEFLGREQPTPDSWYLPNIESRLQWASSVRTPARLNVLLDISSGPVARFRAPGRECRVRGAAPDPPGPVRDRRAGRVETRRRPRPRSSALRLRRAAARRARLAAPEGRARAGQHRVHRHPLFIGPGPRAAVLRATGPEGPDISPGTSRACWSC